MNIKELAHKYEKYIIDMRREFHMYPELSWHEERTSRRVKEELDNMGIPFVSIAKTGVLATIRGKQEGKIIALRADMDALEITERNDVPYKSQNEDVMHACGHDSHTAMLLGAARVLSEIKDKFNGSVRLLFQPAEETANGARKMIEEGAMDDVDEVFGLHVMAFLPTGTIAIGAGPRMASADMFKIIVDGKGGHGSMPHLGVDAIVAASAIVMNLQSIASREVSPMDSIVVSVGSFKSGTRFNIIADEALLEGTTRCFNPEVRNSLPTIMERVVKSTASSYRAEAKLEYIWGTPATINNEASTEMARKSIGKILSEDVIIDFPKMTGAEDFAEYLAKAPGTFALLGTANKQKDTCYSNHHAKFNIDEDVLENGTALHVQYALDFLNK
ncbi:MAG: peptidase M20 [Dethiosulfovibrio peptidovorans]|nr:MAG: peptidase M20 [Dethiosulfovibrio peptidovorans]